jgi:predicted RNase H-like nuclease (RuvC/YqgF family)
MTEKMIEQQYRVVMSEQVRTIERLERRILQLKEENDELSARIVVLEEESGHRAGTMELPGESGQDS